MVACSFITMLKLHVKLIKIVNQHMITHRASESVYCTTKRH